MDSGSLFNKQSVNCFATIEAPVKQNDDDLALFHLLLSTARDGNSAAFQALIEKTSAADLSRVLIKQNKNDNTLLHIVAQYQKDPAAFRALIEKVSSTALNEALVKQNKQGWTALHLAAWCQAGVAFQTLVAIASSEALSAALVKQDNDGQTVLHIIGWRQGPAASLALVEKVSAMALSEALMKRAFGDTVLSIVAKYQSVDFFRAFTAKVPLSFLNLREVAKDMSEFNRLQQDPGYQVAYDVLMKRLELEKKLGARF